MKVFVVVVAVAVVVVVAVVVNVVVVVVLVTYQCNSHHLQCIQICSYIQPSQACACLHTPRLMTSSYWCPVRFNDAIDVREPVDSSDYRKTAAIMIQ